MGTVGVVAVPKILTVELAPAQQAEVSPGEVASVAGRLVPLRGGFDLFRQTDEPRLEECRCR